MPTLIVCNAFSLSMLPASVEGFNVRVLPLMGEDGARAVIKEFEDMDQHVTSAVGHKDTAALFTNILDFWVPANRISVTMTPGDTVLLVGQYLGPRLPEGATELPAGASIKWYSVGCADVS